MKHFQHLFFFLFFLFGLTSLYAETEPNDTCTQANLLFDTNTQTDSGFTQGTITNGSDDDWYKLIITQKAEYTLNKEKITNKKTIIELLESDCTTNAGWTKDGKTSNKNILLNIGTYYLKVSKSGDDNVIYKVSAKARRISDLSITKSVNNPAPNIGDTVLYTIVGTNNGADTSDFNITDTLPAGLAFDTSYYGDGVRETQGSFSCSTSGQTATCQGNSNFDAAESVTITIQAIVNQSGTLTNNTSIISRNNRFDTDLSNNNSSVDITVAAANQAPTADAITVSTDQDTPVSVTLNGSDPDGDPIYYAIVSGPSNGGLSGTEPTLTYTPNSGYVGSDSFVYQVCENTGLPGFLCTNATVSITINQGNRAPVITSNGGGDSAVININDTDTNITTVIATDADVGDTLTYSISGTDSALFSIVSGTGVLTANANLTGGHTYTITATVSDGNASDEQNISINVARTDLTEEPGQCGVFANVLTTYDHLYAEGNNAGACNTENISYPTGEISGNPGTVECFASPTCANNSPSSACLREDPPAMQYNHSFPTNSLSGTNNTPSNPVLLQDLEYGDLNYGSNNGGVTIAFNPLNSYSNTSQKIMLLGDVTVNGGYTLAFAPGDYYFDSLTITGNNNAIVLPGGGPVRIFIQGDYTVKMNNLETNTAYANDPGDLLIYVNGNVVDTSNGAGTANLSAFMYVEGDVTLNNNSANWEIRGGITAEGSITINGNNPHFIQVGDAGDLGLGDCSCVTVGFELPSYSISEDIQNIGSEEFVETRIILEHSVPYDVTVVYNTEDGDPIIGNPARVNDGDYRRKVDQLITIPAGETNVSLPIGIFNDAPIELDEHFFVQLSDPQPSSNICLNDINRTKINILAQYDAPVCFEDHFDNGLDAKWRVLRSIGSFTPQIVTTANGDNRLRLTNNSTNQATTITKDYEFETSQNLIIVEFDYYAYGGCGNNGGLGSYGADGIVNTLFDSLVGATPQPGGRGGSMGYAQINTSQPGFEGGWLGLGIDEYGNFGNCNEGRIGGLPGTSCDNNNRFNPQSYTNTAVIRGDGNGFTGYEFLEGVVLNTIPGQTPVAARRSDNLSDYSSGIYKMTIDARDPAHLYIRLERDLKDGNGYQLIIDQFDAKDAQYNQGITPAKVRYAISAGTGGGCNNHELNWIRLKGNCGIYGDAPATGPFDAWDTFRNNPAVVPTDKNISTKIVEKPFALKLASLDETLSGYETKSGAGSNIAVAIYRPGTLVPISNIVNFDANTSYLITSDDFNLAQAYDDAVVGFRLCATVEVPQAQSGYVYRLWPTSNCTGQVNDCTATTTGAPTWHICYSTDHFAVRPDHFVISSPVNPIIAGNSYPIDYSALDGKGQPTVGYSRSQGGSFDITTALNPATPGCQNQTIDMNTTIQFKHGFHEGDDNATYFNTIGDFNLSLHEIAGSEFANIDADDTPFSNNLGSSESLEITPAVINLLHIVPSGYRLTNTLKNAHDETTKSFTYLNDISGTNVKTMAGKLNLSIQALIADDTSAENYETDCYADTTNLKIDYHLSSITPDGSLTQLQYYIPDPLTNGTDALDAPISTANNKTLTIPLTATIFKDGDAGKADLNISLNFDRDRNEVVNPFYMDIGDINLTETDSEVSSEVNNPDRNITYLFGRAKATKDLYDDIPATVANTPITVVVYCNLWPSCPFTAIDSLNAQTNDSNWWLSWNHNENNGDGNITLNSPATVSEGTGNPTVTTNVTVTNAGRDANVNVTSNSTSLPLTVGINLDTTNLTDTNEWLIYNPLSATLDPIPFYKVRFIGTSGWSGVGKTGNVLDINASSTKTRRLNW